MRSVVVDEQLVAPAPLRRADEQVAQGFDEGRAEHGASIEGGVQVKVIKSNLPLIASEAIGEARNEGLIACLRSSQ